MAIPPEGQYLYDEIGNLVRDNAEGVSIDWIPYGKVRQVIKDNGDVINFAYDAAGNRVEKEIITTDTTLTTHYLRDASGNVMATYTNTELKEQPIYGSSRVGVYRGGTEEGSEQLGNKYYELSNHLGNVLAVVTDNIKINESLVNASITSVIDYYPFGLSIAGLSTIKENSKTNKWTFQGQEWQDALDLCWYGFRWRNHQPELGRFFNVDPLSEDYLYNSTFAFSENKVISHSELEGIESIINILIKMDILRKSLIEIKF